MIYNNCLKNNEAKIIHEYAIRIKYDEENSNLFKFSIPDQKTYKDLKNALFYAENVINTYEKGVSYWESSAPDYNISQEDYSLMDGIVHENIKNISNEEKYIEFIKRKYPDWEIECIEIDFGIELN